ncbi:hypothetical protein ES703_63512 [subsurface metagenome]
MPKGKIRQLIQEKFENKQKLEKGQDTKHSRKFTLD